MAGAKDIRAGRAFVELGVSDRLTAGLRAAQRRLQAFGAGVRSLGTRIAAIGTAGLAPLAASVRSFASAGDTLEKMSRRTGIGVEALSELGFAAEQSGADLETLEKGVRTLQRTMNDAERGLSTATDAFADLGLSVERLRGLTPEEQFKLVAEALSRIEDPSKRAALAMQLLGRAGTQLLPLVQNGARGIEELQEQARALGLTVSTEAAAEAALLTDTLNILWRVVKQGVFEIGSALAPTVIDLANAVTRAVVTATRWVRENKAVIVTVAKVAAAVLAAGLALVGLGLLISGVGAVFGVLAGIVGAVGTALGFIGTVLGALLSPIGLVVAAVAGLGTALLVWSGVGGEALAWLRDQFGRLREFVGKVIGGIADALAAGDITLAAEILWLALKLAWQRGVAELNAVWLQARAFFVGTAQKMWFSALASDALDSIDLETTLFDLTSGNQSMLKSLRELAKDLALGAPNDVAAGPRVVARGALRRISASSASSSARRRARSVRPPSRSACIRQTIRLTRYCLWLVRVGSPKTSA
ncbi:MAG: phage tail tape measure protein [Phycisphaeraceae bacterium]|nr:phage tail tape measure protein [Phycisphaeraceae bacterium]